MPDQRHFADDAVELLAQGNRGTDDQRLERQHGLGPALDRGVARDLEVADHLHRARAGLGHGGGFADEHRAGCHLGVDRVAFAMLVPELPVGTVDLKHGMPLLAQEARQAGAI